MEFDAKSFLKTLTTRPGVYRMIDSDAEVLYVGKAKNLKKRVSSYFTRALNRRLQLMVARISTMEIVITNTEAEALILENNLIKQFKPRYNVLLRDDKSYPYLFLSDDEFPRLTLHRGARKHKGRYFGPYPGAGAVRETLHQLQKVFPVRQCEESFYRNRTRPCLQYQIKRCSAPCVALVTTGQYALDVMHTERFLEGKATQVINDLTRRMQTAAEQLEYELAAEIRDQVVSLRKIQERQYVSGEKGDLDIIAVSIEAGRASIQLFTIRDGRNLGNKSWFPRITEDTTAEQLTGAFLTQHYLEKAVPGEILVSAMPPQRELLQQVFSEQRQKKVRISTNVRGERLRWLQMAQHNADAALKARLQDHSGMLERYQQLQESLGLDEIPQRMECYDISHTQGERTVASCVVFNQQGPLKREYRRFNIRKAAAGDDYAAMQEVIQRRFERILKGEIIMPDLLVIDGGKGQLRRVVETLAEMGVSGVQLLGIAKGADRKAGMEQLFLYGKQQALILPSDSGALHLLQQIRDESHRFAITGHRQQRGKARRTSLLEEIPGVGAKRRRQLLLHFGGLQELTAAGAEDIATVSGISHALAHRIYAYLHGD
ncbi:MAG: excinuclease ABC subunit UvrC [Pseudomonadota bacterium]|nr:excinuclease ABC subunit UvrC [Pseudomonadota bacterium]